MESHLVDYGYKIYVTTMLRILAQPRCQQQLPIWPDWLYKKDTVGPTKSVENMAEDILVRSGLTIIDE